MDTQTDSVDFSQLKKDVLACMNDQREARPNSQNRQDDPFNLYHAPDCNSSSPRQHNSHRRRSDCLDVALCGLSAHRPRLSSQPWNLTNRVARSQIESSTKQTSVASKTNPFARSGHSQSQPLLPSTVAESQHRKMPQSFSPSVGGTISDGDTQPLGSWVYKEFVANGPTFTEDRVTEEANGAKQFRTSSPPPTFDEETSQIDLMGALDGENPEAKDIPGQPQPYDSLFAESGRFMPVTPGLMPNQTDHSDEVQDSAETPSLPFDIFGRKGATPNGIMPLSQLFKQTQAPTSPVQNGPFSDPERPSPDVHRQLYSPVSARSSSPLRATLNRPRHAIGEPLNTYVSMKDSQAERERRQQLAEHDKNVSDDEFDSWEERQARRRRQAKIDAKNSEALKAITAPRRNSHQQISGRRSMSATSGMGTESKRTIRASAGCAAGESDTSNESEDELQSDLGSGYHDQPEVQIPDSTNRDRNPRGSNSQETPTISRHSRVTSLRANSSKEQPEDLHKNENVSSSHSQDDTTHTFAIADSQPSMSGPKSPMVHTSPPPETPALPSSVNSPLFISQSQPDVHQRYGQLYTGGDFLADNIISSSLPPPPSNCSMTEHAINHNGNSHVRPLRHSNEMKNATKSSPEPISQRQGGNEVEPASNDLPTNNSSHQPINLQLHHNNGQRNASSASQNYSSSVEQIANTNTTIPETSPASSRYQRSLFAPAANGSGNHEFSSRVIKDSLESADTDSFSTSKRFSFLQGTGNTNFETAHTHILSSVEQVPPEARNLPLPGNSASLPRRMGEIAASPTPPPGSLPEVNLDISLMSTQDREFQRVIEGSSPVAPPRKRRRGNNRIRVASEIDSDTLLSSDPIQAPMPNSRNSVGGILEEELPEPTFNKPGPLKVAAVPNNPASLKRKDFDIVPKFKKNTVKRVNSPQLVPSAAGNGNPTQGRSNAEKEAPVSGRAQGEVPQSRIQPDDEAVGLEAASDVVDGNAINVEEVQAPDRVFAFFNGKSLPAFYPATCLSITREPRVEDTRYEVRFDDGSSVTLESHKLRSLDLRVGDLVKVDFPNLRKQNYVVAGFREKVNLSSGQFGTHQQRRSDEQRYPVTDIRGFSTVALKPKLKETGNQRWPLAEQSGTISVPIGSIYITNSMWAQFKDRLYIPSSKIVSRPSPAVSALVSATVGPTTPSSRSRRTTMIVHSASIKSAKSELSRPTGNLFAGMAFAVTFVDDDDAKTRIVKHIVDNGGRLLVDGFDELFNVDGLEIGNDAAGETGNSQNPFRLTPEAEELGFVCLITDKHSRRAKYIQALALGLPCLAGRWIEDCVSKTKVIDWQPYLLPSGESSFLGGAVHSRILQPYPAETAKFATIVDGRPRLFTGRSVLLIMGKGKAEERRKAYLFLTYALGASRVSRALSVDAAKQTLLAAEAPDQRWDWVYVDEKDKDAESAFWGGATNERARGRKKRRRGEALPLTTPLENNVKVVGDEFVVQSLILGKLLEE